MPLNPQRSLKPREPFDFVTLSYDQSLKICGTESLGTFVEVKHFFARVRNAQFDYLVVHRTNPN